jgi:nicotinamidase-related amidase
MPITALDEHAALVVIDLQKGITGMPTAHPGAKIVARTAELAQAFRKKGLPVVLVNVTGPPPGRTEQQRRTFQFSPDWAELDPALGQQPEDLLVSKQRYGAFIGTNLDELLRQRGVTQIFLAGISTSSGVESTGRSAFDYGYNVAFVVDAMTDRDAETHKHSVEKVFPRIGETDSTENVLSLLAK